MPIAFSWFTFRILHILVFHLHQMFNASMQHAESAHLTPPISTHVSPYVFDKKKMIKKTCSCVEADVDVFLCG